ncbi:MAG TPA: restriction endonuclease subunit S [Pyrinomonadaceae bacterium]
MNNFPRYESYKDSGVDWLGKIPEHWEAVSLGSLMELKSDKNHPEFEVLSVYREYGVIKKDSRDDNHNATSLDTTTYKAVEPGDLVVNKMKAWQGSMGISSYKGIVSPAYITCKITAKKVHSEYLHRLLRSNSYIGEYNRISYGVRIGQWDMHYEDFKRVTVVLPPKEEQAAIAEFLDRKTAQIDQAIAQKEKLIELLQERRQILIHNAVTRGLNPNVKMKHSGVDWLGEIPDHWEVEKGKWLFQQMKRPVRTEDEIVTCFRDGVVTLRANRRTEGFTNALQEHGYQGIRKGDLVIHNMDAFAGAIGVSDSDGKSTPVYSVCVPKDSKKVNSYFFALLLRKLAKDGFIESLAKGIRERSTDFRFNDFANLMFSVPSLTEQNEIVIYCREISQKIETAISFKQKEIEKLKEYKAVLINSAVTGKIEVCGNSQNAEMKMNYA